MSQILQRLTKQKLYIRKAKHNYIKSTSYSSYATHSK